MDERLREKLLDTILGSLTNKLSESEILLVFAILKKSWKDSGDYAMLSLLLHPVIRETYRELRSLYSKELEAQQTFGAKLQADEKLWEQARKQVLAAVKQLA